MSNAFVQISPDGSGKRIQTFENVISGQTVEATAVCQVDSDGNPISASNPIPVDTKIGTDAGATLVFSTFYENSKVLKASAGTLVSLQGYTSATGDQWLQFFNSATVPGGGTKPAWFIPIPAGVYFSVDVPITGFPFTTGISVSNSTTPTTRTAGGNNMWFVAVVV